MSQSSQIRDVVRKAGFPMNVDQIAEQLPTITRSNISAICSGMKKQGVFKSCVEDQRVAYSLAPGAADVELTADPPERPETETEHVTPPALTDEAEASPDLTNLSAPAVEAAEELLRGRTLAVDKADKAPVSIQVPIAQPAGRRVASKREYRNIAHQTAYLNGQQAKRRGRQRTAPYDIGSPSSAHYGRAWLDGYDSVEVDSDVVQERNNHSATDLLKGISDRIAPVPAGDAGPDMSVPELTCEVKLALVSPEPDRQPAPARPRIEIPDAALVPDDASALLRQLVAAVLGSWPGQVPENVRVLVRSAITTVF